MKPLLAVLVALLLACTLTGWPVVGASADQAPAGAGAHPAPEATKKKKAKPTASPTATPTPAAPRATVPTRRPVDAEGERWVQIAMFAGGGLLAAVLGFFAIGSVLRFTAKRRAGR